YLFLEKADGTAPASLGRGYPYSGFYDCPFQVWDVTHHRQLDALFVERARALDDNGTLSPDTTLVNPAMDRTWGPTQDPDGAREYLFVSSRPYDGTAKDELRVDHALDRSTFPLLFTLAARRR